MIQIYRLLDIKHLNLLKNALIRTDDHIETEQGDAQDHDGDADLGHELIPAIQPNQRKGQRTEKQ